LLIRMTVSNKMAYNEKYLRSEGFGTRPPVADDQKYLKFNFK